MPLTGSHGRRRRLALIAAAIAIGFGCLSLLSTPNPASAQTSDLAACPDDLNDVATGTTTIRIVKVNGLIDPVVHSFVLDQLDQAEEKDLLAMVLWLDSGGSVLGQEEFVELATRLDESPVTIAVWVGQSGATAIGGAAELLGVADLVGISPGSTVGSTGPARLPSSFPPAFGQATERLEATEITADEAVQLGISIGPLSDVATILPFVAQIPGYEVIQCQDTTATVAGGDDGGSADDSDNGLATIQNTPGLRTIPVTQNQLTGLSLTSQLFHTVASPEVAYLFFALGLGLLVFELFTAGVGIAGVIGAILLSLGCYGLAVLPTRWWGIGLIIAAFLAMAVDIQTNVPRLYSALGIGLFVAGTFTLYDGLSISWVTVIAGIVGAVLYAYTGMPTMVRSRFSTPTIGRRWMIGEMGEAITDVSPEGTVKIRDVAWRATTNRATPVSAGDPVRVVGLDRLLLEIEPEEGGARDYRDRG
ncbi:MAG: hypothetical protein GY773_20365 [Actinomycetia bacterium]|nr:hypothetical protein [Actinomycetes bacterium]